MTSRSFQALSDALVEILELGEAGAGTFSPVRARRLRVVGRGQVVLLSSHFERYIYSLNEEAVAHLNGQPLAGSVLPTELRLLHSSKPVDELSLMQWRNRREALGSFVESDAWLWSQVGTGSLTHDRLLTWMKAPNARELVRYFKYWQIDDIFSAVTRTPPNRQRLYLGVQELVDKRNEIAHGDYNAQATRTDVARYISAVKTFSERADRALAKAVARITGGQRPW